jgi:DNA repair exonuclease SbcCD ATPase subunit
MSNLTDRIALILQTEAASDALAGIINDARAELEAINEACAGAKERVLDPLANSAAVTKAKKEMEDQTLQASRLEAAIDRLSSQLEAAHAREAEAARTKIYEEARTERDALAEDLRAVYPQAAARIAALLVRIEAADQKVAAANQDRPEDAPWLEPVEMVVRDRKPNEGAPLYRSVKLPALLEKDTYWNSFWPVKQG